MTKVLAMDKEGNLSYCSVPPDQRGNSRGCTHISHVAKGQNVKDFIKNSSPEAADTYSLDAPDRVSGVVNLFEIPVRLDEESDDSYEIKRDIYDRLEIFNQGYEKPWEKLIHGEMNQYEISEEQKKQVISLMKLIRYETSGSPMEYYKTVSELTNGSPSNAISGLPKKLREEINAYASSCFYSSHNDEVTSFETLTASRAFIDEKKREKIGIPK